MSVWIQHAGILYKWMMCSCMHIYHIILPAPVSPYNECVMMYIMCISDVCSLECDPFTSDLFVCVCDLSCVTSAQSSHRRIRL